MNQVPHRRSYQDPELSSVVRSICERLTAFPQEYDGEALQYSVSTGTLDEPALFATAQRLCDEGDFASALPLALHLTLAAKGRSEYAFVAASCLQRLGLIDAALALFAVSAQTRDDNPAAWFRTGECLKALGKTGEALEALQRSIELAREDARYAPLQDAARRMADSLR